MKEKTAPPIDCPSCGRERTAWVRYRLFTEEKGPEVGCGKCGHVESLSALPPCQHFYVNGLGEMVAIP